MKAIATQSSGSDIPIPEQGAAIEKRQRSNSNILNKVIFSKVLQNNNNSLGKAIQS